MGPTSKKREGKRKGQGEERGREGREDKIGEGRERKGEEGGGRKEREGEDPWICSPPVNIP